MGQTSINSREFPFAVPVAVRPRPLRETKGGRSSARDVASFESSDPGALVKQRVHHLANFVGDFKIFRKDLGCFLCLHGVKGQFISFRTHCRDQCPWLARTAAPGICQWPGIRNHGSTVETACFSHLFIFWKGQLLFYPETQETLKTGRKMKMKACSR